MFEEETMSCRRLVGIDLGIASAHAVRVLDEEGTTLAKRKAVPTVESLSLIESSALEGTPAGTRLEVVIEPTGPAWLPIAVFFINRGHVVYRVSSPSRRTCVGICPATPRPMASMRTRWRGSRCSIPEACSRSSCRARIGPRWIGGFVLRTG